MLKAEVEKRLGELKNFEYITITTDNGIYSVDSRTIINDTSKNRLIIDFDSKSYDYYRILSIEQSF